MRTPTGSLASSRTANRAQCFKLEIQWDGSNWINESAYVIDLTVTQSAVSGDASPAAVGSGIAGEARILLNNGSRRFTPWNAGGALYSYISSGQWHGRAVRISFGYLNASGVPEYMQVFIGKIKSFTPSVVGQNVDLVALDYGSLLAAHKARSPLYHNYRVDQLIEAYVALLPEAIRPTVQADKGMMTIPWHYLDDDSIFGEISRLAEAEGGRIYFDYQGQLIFENAAHLVSGAHGTSQMTFSVNDWSELYVSADWRAYYNHIEVWYHPIRLMPIGEIWASREIHRVPAGQSKTITAKFDAPAYYVLQPEADKDYIATSPGGQKRTEDISITALAQGTNLWAQQAELQVTNSGEYDLLLRRLRLRGRSLLSGDEEKVEISQTDALAERSGRITLSIRDNLAIQTKVQAERLRDILAQRYKAPVEKASLDDLKVVPWLELGDRVTVTERNGELNVDFFVESITYRASGRGIWMRLELVRADGLFAYPNQYFILGTNTLGSSSTNPGRAFY